MSVRDEVVGELRVLIEKERRALAAVPVGGPLATELRADLQAAKAGLDALESWAEGGDVLELPARASHAFKRSIAARTSSLRHTPALEGTPVAMDPRQAPGGRHLVDYARGGYFLELDPAFPEGVRFDDHPRLAELAHAISTMLGRSGWDALLFSSGMGAMNTALDLAIERSAGRRVLVGASSWIEVREYVDHTYPSRVAFIDETDTEAMRRALADPTVGAISLEPLVNHPHAPVVAIDQLLRGAIVGPKILLLDLALTPELPIDRFLPVLPANVTVMLVTSGVKFFQAGWDLSKSGLLEIRSGPSNERPWETPYRQLITLRGRSGRVLSPEEAELAAIETRETLTARLARSDRNTRALAIALEEKQVGTVSSPWLSSHVHHDRIDAIGTGGRFVYLRFDPQRLSSERLATFDRALAIAAARAGIPLMVATTFGLSLPHVCLLAHPTEGLTLRISPGSGDDFSAALANLLAHLLDGT